MALKKSELNDKQEKFCMEYIKCFNATQAYINAYNSTYNNAMYSGCRLLRNDKISRRIDELKKEMRHNYHVEMDDVIGRIFRIAFYDIGNYVKTKDGKVIVKSLDDVDTSLIESIKETSNGIELKLKDSKWAMDYLIKHYDMFPNKWQRKIEEEKLKLLKVKTLGDVGEVDEGKLSAWLASLDDESIKTKSIDELERLYHESIDEE